MQYPMFHTLDYLKNGSEIQRKSFNLLKEYMVFEHLSEYNPILIGTIPIDIAIEESDLDIACEVYDLKEFEKNCLKHFGIHKEYNFKIKTLRGKEVGIVNFKIADMRVELYAEGIVVTEQYGYKHMVKEHHLLMQFGQVFRTEILRLKAQGIKTEAAFAHLLNLEGDPYESLLTYNNLIDVGDKKS
mgnify:CR=1 FL=1